jgi:hypothetical protein
LKKLEYIQIDLPQEDLGDGELEQLAKDDYSSLLDCLTNLSSKSISSSVAKRSKNWHTPVCPRKPKDDMGGVAIVSNACANASA